MNRFFAFLLALLFATVSVSSACVAAPSDWIDFTLATRAGSNEIKASFDESRGGRDNHWSTGVMPSQLIGFDIAGFRGAGTRPLRFAVVREAGRLDCSGQGGSGHATGNCAFTPDPAFMDLLARRGIGRPDREQAFGMMALDVRREIVDALAASRYPTPTINHLIELTAVGVNSRYIADLARAGYHPQTIQTLVEFRALDITPEWIGGFARIGYSNIPSEDLVQLRALDITPEFVSGFNRLGYGRLPVDRLVELKALNITPEFVRAVTRQGESMPPVSELVERKIFGSRR